MSQYIWTDAIKCYCTKGPYILGQSGTRIIRTWYRIDIFLKNSVGTSFVGFLVVYFLCICTNDPSPWDDPKNVPRSYNATHEKEITSERWTKSHF